MTQFEMKAAGGTVKLIDYASAGKTWDSKSEMEAWLKGDNIEEKMDLEP